MPNHYINIAEIIADKIKVRYAEITERTVGSSNMVVDAFYPTYVRESITRAQQPRALGKRCTAISPFIASELNVFQMPFEDAIKMLGYKKIQLKAMLEQVKAKKLTLVLAGLGGTGMNFMHWAEEVCNFTNTVAIFDSIEIYDADKIDLTNIFRFPQKLNPEDVYSRGQNSSLSKVSLLNRNSILSRSRMQVSSSFITIDTVTNKIRREYDANGSVVEVNPPRIEFKEQMKSKIFYGAPDIASREAFSQFPDMQFVSGTHGDDDCQLYIKPLQDSSIQIESYGMINLSVFFMNQIKLTLSFLELLASDTDLTKTNLVMEYSFSKEYIEGRIQKAGLNRTYNFPIIVNNLIDQEVGMLDVAADEEQAQVEASSEEPVNETPVLPTDFAPITSADIERVANTLSEQDGGTYVSNFVPMPPPPPQMPQPVMMPLGDTHIGDVTRAVNHINEVADAAARAYVANTVASEVPEPQVVAPVRVRARRRTRAEIDAANALMAAGNEGEGAVYTASAQL